MKDKYLVRICKYESGKYPYFLKRKRNSIFSWRWRELEVTKGNITDGFVQTSKKGIMEFCDKFDPFNVDKINLTNHYGFVDQESCNYVCKEKL